METIFDHCTDKKILEQFTLYDNKSDYLLNSDYNAVNYDLMVYYNYTGDAEKRNFFFEKMDNSAKREFSEMMIA